MPKTFCHKDAFRRNMFSAQDGQQQPRLTLIDRAYVGLGEIGLDIADLFTASYSMFGVEATDLHTFDNIIFTSYVDGLHAVGWQGEPQLGRFGFAASAALKYGDCCSG